MLCELTGEPFPDPPAILTQVPPQPPSRRESHADVPHQGDAQPQTDAQPQATTSQTSQAEGTSVPAATVEPPAQVRRSND